MAYSDRSATVTGPVPTAVRSAEPTPRPRRRWRPGELLGYGMVAPAVLILVGITAYPLVYNVWNSLHYDDLFNPAAGHRFTGLQNYRSVFSSSTGLLPAIEHTLLYTLVSVSIEMAIGLGIALLLDRPMRGRGACRTLILLPWAVPTVISAVVWKTLLDQQSGGVDYLLGLLHLPGAHTTWLNAGQISSWAAILVADAWQSIPFVAILLLAGLQGIPRDLFEAARMDGASAWHRFTHITLPMLRPALLVTLVFRTLQSLLIFDIVYALTAGGPGESTTTLAYLNWHAFLVEANFGVGGAISVLMVFVAIVVAGLYRFALRPVE